MPLLSRFSFSRTEAKKVFHLVVPVFFAQMSQMLMGVVDTVMTGHYVPRAAAGTLAAGREQAVDMAAVALASSVWMPVSLFGVGVMLALTPLVAQRMGAGDRKQVPHFVRQGIVLALLMSLPLTALLLYLAEHIHWFGIEGALGEICAGYLRAVTWGLPGFLLFVTVRALPEGDARTRPAMLISFSGLLLNIPCNYVLMHGCFGLPELGGIGCGVATALVFWCMSAALILYTRSAASWRDLHPLYLPPPGERRPDFVLMARILRIGLPGALALLFEIGAFSIASLLLAPLGAVVVAGHQATLNFAGVLFMLPLSLGITATIRVGRCLGAERPESARIAAETALCIGCCLAFAVSAGTAFFRHEIAACYSVDPGVRALAARLLLFAAFFQFADAVQAISIGALRGYNDTRFISFACFIGYWCLGLPAGFILARTDIVAPAMGAEGFWAGFILSLLVIACLLLRRLRKLHRLDAGAVQVMVRR